MIPGSYTKQPFFCVDCNPSFNCKAISLVIRLNSSMPKSSNPSNRNRLISHIVLCMLCFFKTIVAVGQVEVPQPKIVITYLDQKTSVKADEQGELQVNVSPKDLLTFKRRGSVSYNDLGALGDGKTDDIDAIAATHAFANQQGLTVKGYASATYYIGGKNRTANIQTNTDFGTAAFIIDDTEVQNRTSPVFLVSSGRQPLPLNRTNSLKRNQKKIEAALPGSCLITVKNSNVNHYIRFGLNQDNGAPQTDLFLVDKNGKVHEKTPIIWDFNQITEITALPIDEKPLTVTGGRFTTIANKAAANYTYYSRNIRIKRSSVVVDGLEHRVKGEGDQGAPYEGFLHISDCANVTVKNCVFTGHKTYSTIGRAGKPVSMGTYDIIANRALNVSFINCTQTNDINDRTYWGIMGSNYCKNLLFDRCVLSRFDAHKGVANATIRNSTLGHAGVNAIGSGTLLIENSTIRGNHLFNLRPDYGSTWQGEVLIRNCTFVPSGGRQSNSALIGGAYTGQHDFGYPCYMPERILIQNLHIDDSNHPANYNGPAVFANFNTNMTDDTYKEKFPYGVTKEVVLQNVTTASGKALRMSDNTFMFRNVDMKVK